MKYLICDKFELVQNLILNHYEMNYTFKINLNYFFILDIYSNRQLLKIYFLKKNISRFYFLTYLLIFFFFKQLQLKYEKYIRYLIKMNNILHQLCCRFLYI